MLLIDEIKEKKTDAVLFKAAYLIKTAGSDADAYAHAVSTIAMMLNCIANGVKRDVYLQQICKQHKIKPKLLQEEIANTAVAEEDVTVVPEGVQWSFPHGVDIEQALRKGFYAHEDKTLTGFYFPAGQQGEWRSVSNFILKPLMHVMSTTDDKRLFEINNGMERQMIDLPSRQMIQLDQFVGRMFEAPGNNLFWGTKLHLMKILDAIGREFQYCYELKTLGWQQEGFFAYSNGVVSEDGFIPMDEIGVALVGDKKFYSPSASNLYRNVRNDDDEYQNDRYLLYKEAPLTFEKWCALMVKVYAESDSGMIGIAIVLMGIFQDIIRSVDKNCPHLSAYGEKSSGKSKFLESLSNVFFNDLPPCNLFHSTDFAFANRLSRYSNCVVWFDEFNDATIREERFEAIKAAYEGVARERGKGGSKNKTEILRVKCLLVLSGQYLSTKDDNSALTRCIVVPFKKRGEENARTNEEIKMYEQLKNYEAEGLSGMLLEMLQYRKEFNKWYVKNFPEVFADMRDRINKTHRGVNERVLRNYCALLACVTFFGEKLKLPFKTNDFIDLVKREVIKLSNLISESDSLADFWNTVVFLMESGEIYEGYHYKIEEHKQVTIGNANKVFDVPVKLLFLRLTTVHSLYLQAHRRQSGLNGVNKSTIELYLTTSKGYIGQNKSGRFTDQDGNSVVTSSYVFDYDKLGVGLERFAKTAEKEEKVLKSFTGTLHGESVIKDVAGVPKIYFTLMADECYTLIGTPVQNFVRHQCYDANLENQTFITSGHPIKVTGEASSRKWKAKDGTEMVTRMIEVTEVKIAEKQTSLDVGGEGKDDVPF